MLQQRKPTLSLYLLANSPQPNWHRKSKLANRLGNWLPALQIETEVGFNTHLPYTNRYGSGNASGTYYD